MKALVGIGILLFIGVVWGNNVLGEDGPIALTQYGKIKGTTTKAVNGRVIYSFKSIPYAKPPGRFEPPIGLKVEEDGWGDDIRDGTKNPPSCAQFLTSLSPPSEDCLQLNVYTPIKPGTSDQKLPVMFYIYGGGYLFGDTVIYGPNRLMAHEPVVLVVINYRLGALGFLSTGDNVISGNNGLKDMREALRWVQANIDAFGGDRNQVTVFGESAGGAAALSLLISHSTRGLFQKVIAQSGSPLAIWTRDIHPRQSAERFATSVNCTIKSTQAMVSCLKELPWEPLAKASFMNLLTDVSNLKLQFDAAAMVVESDHEGAFLIREPVDILEAKDYPDIPVLMGATQHEGSAVLGAAWALNLAKDDRLSNPDYVRFKLIPDLLKALRIDERSVGGPAAQIAAQYFLPKGIDKGNFTEITPGVVDLLSVFLFKATILRTADYLSQHSQNVFFYSFEREGINTIWTLVFDLLTAVFNIESPPIKHGVMHADDLIYFWTLPFIITSEDRKFSDMVCRMWTDFAITGNPTPGDLWPTWLPYTVSNPNYYKLDVQPKLLSDYTTSWRKGTSQ